MGVLLCAIHFRGERANPGPAIWMHLCRRAVAVNMHIQPIHPNSFVSHHDPDHRLLANEVSAMVNCIATNTRDGRRGGGGGVGSNKTGGWGGGGESKNGQSGMRDPELTGDAAANDV